uniref:Tp-Lhcr18 n=1 Tax=Thalassiosira pseudonana CCMP1335 TaxID=296543 RepID=UPI003908BC93
YNHNSGGVNFKGDTFQFDPLGLSETYAPLVPFFRESEIRHGRTAMLAVTGFIVQDFVRIPGDAYSFEAVPKTVGAHDALLEGPMHQLLLWISLWDIVITYPSIQATMKGEREPGDFGWKWLAPKDEATLKKYEMNELLNGRLAMMAVG